MTLETISTKRNRVYQRKFDWDEAARHHRDGWSYQAIADHYHVSKHAVVRVLNANERRRVAANNKAWVAALCDDCGGECTHNWASKNARHDRVVCRKCSAQRAREDGLLNRHNPAGDIRCGHCQRHYPPESFRFNRDGFPAKWCRSCETAARREYRHTHPESTT